jgi:molybdate transport system ATP-binding protein
MIRIRAVKQLAKIALDVDLTLPDRGLTAVFGRSGSGKTTLINILSGLMDPDAGSISVNGQALYDLERRIKVPVYERRMGYVFQEARLFPHLTVRSNLRYGYNPDGQIRMDEVVGLLGIAQVLDRRPHYLSGGEKQRVAIGRALLTNPHLLLMDEPLSALDESRKNEIIPFIERVRDEFQTPIFYVTHSRAEVAKLANYVVVLADGKVIASCNAPTSSHEWDKLLGTTKNGAEEAAA